MKFFGVAAAVSVLSCCTSTTSPLTTLIPQLGTFRDSKQLESKLEPTEASTTVFKLDFKLKASEVVVKLESKLESTEASVTDKLEFLIEPTATDKLEFLLEPTKASAADKLEFLLEPPKQA